MAVTIIKPSFRVPPLEELVLDAQGRPVFTMGSHGLQYRNQLTLWQLFLESGVELPRKGEVLDAGCGDGLFFALAPYMIFPEPKDRRPIVGVDIEPRKVKQARRVATLVDADYNMRTQRHLSYIVQDPQDLATMSTTDILVEGSKLMSFPKMALVWSNSMFHWIRAAKDKYAALSNFNTLLMDRGALCISMSAGGTARDFLEAYANVMRGLGVYDRNFNSKGYHRAELESDPIGSRPLDELVNMVEESGFDVVLACTLAESVTYASPKQYSGAVEVYGRDAFLMPVTHYSNSRKKDLWREIETEFLKVLGDRGWMNGDPFTYIQFNNYVIAVKRPQYSPEQRLLTAIVGERSGGVPGVTPRQSF